MANRETDFKLDKQQQSFVGKLSEVCRTFHKFVHRFLKYI